MKVKICILILILFYISFPGARAQAKNLNISFLLDLSDRIDPKKNPGLGQRDIQYIQSVQQAFLRHIKKKKMMLMKDQMQVFFDPLPNLPNIEMLSQQLKVNITPSTSKREILAIDKTYTQNLNQIYQSAYLRKQYDGSDIWRFFKNNVENYCIKAEHRNILFILTDGYMFHKKSLITDGKGKSSYLTSAMISKMGLNNPSYLSRIKKANLGFIPFTKNLQDLEIVVLGINPAGSNPYEEDIVKQYWSDWFKAMHVKKFQLITADLAAFIDPVIQKIML